VDSFRIPANFRQLVEKRLTGRTALIGNTSMGAAESIWQLKHRFPARSANVLYACVATDHCRAAAGAAAQGNNASFHLTPTKDARCGSSWRMRAHGTSFRDHNQADAPSFRIAM
jgi:hypothetical protein